MIQKWWQIIVYGVMCMSVAYTVSGWRGTLLCLFFWASIPLIINFIRTHERSTRQSNAANFLGSKVIKSRG